MLRQPSAKANFQFANENPKLAVLGARASIANCNLCLSSGPMVHSYWHSLSIFMAIMHGNGTSKTVAIMLDHMSTATHRLGCFILDTVQQIMKANLR